MPGPQITYFGLTTADSHVIASSGTDDQGRPIFTRLFGAGFFLVIEAKAGASNSAPDTRNFYNPSDPTSRPDVQILADHNLGNGSAAVCDNGPAPAYPLGGVPGFTPIDFDPNLQVVTDALNDLGCRLADNTIAPCTLDANDRSAFVNSTSTTQVCNSQVIGQEMLFPSGDTILTAQWRDRAGNIGRPVSIVIRVQ